MTKKTETVFVSPLRDGKQPLDRVRAGVDLPARDKLESAQIIFNTVGCGAPNWSKFLDLTDAERPSRTPPPFMASFS